MAPRAVVFREHFCWNLYSFGYVWLHKTESQNNRLKQDKNLFLRIQQLTVGWWVFSVKLYPVALSSLWGCLCLDSSRWLSIPVSAFQPAEKTKQENTSLVFKDMTQSFTHNIALTSASQDLVSCSDLPAGEAEKCSLESYGPRTSRMRFPHSDLPKPNIQVLSCYTWLDFLFRSLPKDLNSAILVYKWTYPPFLNSNKTILKGNKGKRNIKNLDYHHAVYIYVSAAVLSILLSLTQNSFNPHTALVKAQ